MLRKMLASAAVFMAALTASVVAPVLLGYDEARAALEVRARVEVTATVSGTGAVTSMVANSGRVDFTFLDDGNYTYGYIEQGSLWEECTLTKSGSTLIRSNVTDSSSGGSSVSFDGASSSTVFIDIPVSKFLIKNASGGFDNADPLLATVALNTLADLKAVALPATSGLARYVRGLASATAGTGAWYYWDAADATAGDDYNYVVSNNSATGRWIRVRQQLDPATAANDGAVSSGAVARVSGDLRSKHPTYGAKGVPEVNRFHQGEYITLAEWKALASSQWKAGDTFVFRGITAENDLGNDRLTFKWDASSTNTDALDITHLRPDDISGSNAGRAVLVEPAAIAKFADGDASPSVKGARNFRGSDAGTTITALDDAMDLQVYRIFPGAANVTFTHSASFVMPGNTNFTLLTAANGGEPVDVVYENGVGYLKGSGGAGLKADLASTANGKGASLVGVADAGGDFDATTVEAALTELADGGAGIWEVDGQGHIVLRSDPDKATDFPAIEIDLIDSARGLARVPNFQVVDFGDPPDVSCLYGEGTRGSPTTNTTVGGHTCKFYNWNFDGTNFTGDNVAPFLEIDSSTRAERDASGTCAITVSDTAGVGTITITDNAACHWTLNANTGLTDRKFETNFAVEIVSAGNPSLEDKKLVVTGVTSTVLSYTSRHGALADVGPVTSGLKVKEVAPVITPYLGWSGYIGWRSLEIFDDHSKGALMDFATTAPDQIATIPRMWLTHNGLTVGPTALIYCATYPWSIRDIPNDQQFLPCDTFNPHEFTNPAYLAIIAKDIDTKPAFGIVPEAEPTFRLYAGWDESDDEFKFRTCENTTECHPFLTVRGDTQYVKLGGRSGTQEVMAFDGADSAVNAFVAENATTGNAPKLRTNGTDTDIAFNFETEGTADIRFHNGIHVFEEDGDATFKSVATGATGPIFGIFHDTASPANGDFLDYRFFGRDSGGTDIVPYGVMRIEVLDPTNASEDSRLEFYTLVAGASTREVYAAGGLVVGAAPTGGAKGVGSINVDNGYFSDNVAVTDYVFDFWHGEYEHAYSEIVAEKAAMLDKDMLEIDAYSEFWKKERRLFGLPDLNDRLDNGAADWKLEDLIQALWQDAELQAIHIDTLNQKIKTLEAELADARAMNAGYETRLQDFEERLSKMEVGGAPLRAINDNYNPANDNEEVERMMYGTGGR